MKELGYLQQEVCGLGDEEVEIVTQDCGYVL